LATTTLSFAPGDTRPVQVFFQDEARFGRINIPVACWAPKGQRPSVSKQIVRQYIYAYSAVNPANGDIFSILAPNCNTEIMSLFMENLSEEYHDYRNVIILDKAGWHTTNYLKRFDNVRYLFLPPYSPELNPAEHLWSTIRDLKFRNTTFASLKEVEKALIESFKYLDRNKDLVSKLTHFKWLLLDI
jgi:transposase